MENKIEVSVSESEAKKVIYDILKKNHLEGCDALHFLTELENSYISQMHEYVDGSFADWYFWLMLSRYVGHVWDEVCDGVSLCVDDESIQERYSDMSILMDEPETDAVLYHYEEVNQECRKNIIQRNKNIDLFFKDVKKNKYWKCADMIMNVYYSMEDAGDFLKRLVYGKPYNNIDVKCYIDAVAYIKFFFDWFYFDAGSLTNKGKEIGREWYKNL